MSSPKKRTRGINHSWGCGVSLSAFSTLGLDKSRRPPTFVRALRLILIDALTVNSRPETNYANEIQGVEYGSGIVYVSPLDTFPTSTE